MQGKTAGVPPEVTEGVDLLHIAGRVQMLHSRFYPSIGFFLDLPLFRYAELSTGGAGKLPLQTGPGLGCGGMPLVGLFSHS